MYGGDYVQRSSAGNTAIQDIEDHTAGWCRLLQGSLVDEVSRLKDIQDIVVIGSSSVVRTLMDHHQVDEYRLLVFPTVIGEERRLFPAGIAPINLELVSAERSGAAMLLTYRQASERS